MLQDFVYAYIIYILGNLYYIFLAISTQSWNYLSYTL